MTDRIRSRMKEVGMSGIGSGYTVNQELSIGLSEEDAETAAEIARAEALQAQGEEPAPEDIPPPDMEDPSQDELRLAGQVVDLLRTMPDSRNLEEEDKIRSETTRKMIESQLEPLDLAEIMFAGRVTQRVPLAEGKLTLELESLTSQHYALIDRWIYSHLIANIQLPLKHRLRFITAAALTINSVGGKPAADGAPWPDSSKDVLAPSFQEWADFFQKRLDWLLKMNPSVVELITTNVTWFEQRVRRAIGNLLYVGQEVKKS